MRKRVRERAESKQARKVETIAIVDGLHPNEELTSHILKEAVKEPFLRRLLEKRVVHIVKMPFKFTAHARAALAKRYIGHLYETNPLIKETVHELHEKKEGLFRNSLEMIDMDAVKQYDSKKGELMNMLESRIEEDLARMGSIEDKELVEILKKIKENRNYLKGGGYSFFCKQKVGKKPDVIIQLHTTSDRIMDKEWVMVPKDLEDVLERTLTGKDLKPSETEDITLEWPARYRRCRDFEKPLDLPGAKIETRRLLLHPGLDKNFALALDVPVLMDVLYKKGNKEDLNYKYKIVDYIGKAEHTPEKIEKGKELLIKVLQALVERDQ